MADQPSWASPSLVDELEMPLPDSAVDRVLLVHALEMAHDPTALLREIWRVLSSGGRLLVVVPNRRGVWARMDTTPFGHGRPYSRSQITQLMRETWFTPTGWGEALHVPPVARRWFLRSAVAWERVGGIDRERHSPAYTSSRRPSRSIGSSRRGASARAWCRPWSPPWRRRPEALRP